MVEAEIKAIRARALARAEAVETEPPFVRPAVRDGVFIPCSFFGPDPPGNQRADNSELPRPTEPPPVADDCTCFQCERRRIWATLQQMGRDL